MNCFLGVEKKKKKRKEKRFWQWLPGEREQNGPIKDVRSWEATISGKHSIDELFSRRVEKKQQPKTKNQIIINKQPDYDWLPGVREDENDDSDDTQQDDDGSEGNEGCVGVVHPPQVRLGDAVTDKALILMRQSHFAYNNRLVVLNHGLYCVLGDGRQQPENTRELFNEYLQNEWMNI